MTPETHSEARPFDLDRIQEAVRMILDAVGEDGSREGLVETPRRIAQMYAEILSGLHTDPRAHMEVSFADDDHDEMVVLNGIPFYSLCEHHFLPFHGVAHVGYLPVGRLVGMSKLARVVDTFARRPQLQERLTSQIADCIMEALQPLGVGVIIEAEHLCMTMRGIKKPGGRLKTSAMRGYFRERPATRAEFLALAGER